MEEKKNTIQNDLPVGFGFSLAINEKAMKTFASLDEEEKRRVLSASREQHTKEDMERFVNHLSEGFEGEAK